MYLWEERQEIAIRILRLLGYFEYIVTIFLKKKNIFHDISQVTLISVHCLKVLFNEFINTSYNCQYQESLSIDDIKVSLNYLRLMAFNVHIVMQPSYISQKSHFVEQNNSLNFTMTFPAQAFKQITKVPSLFFL